MPGPSPLHCPCFSSEFVAQAQRLIRRRTAPSHLRQRAKLVLLLHQDPQLSNVEAGASVGLHPNSVRLWRQRWTEGQFDLADQAGRGRKASFSPPGPRAGRGSGL